MTDLPNDFEERVRKLVEGELSAEDHAALADELLHNEALFDFYVEYVTVHGLLKRRFASNLADQLSTRPVADNGYDEYVDDRDGPAADDEAATRTTSNERWLSRVLRNHLGVGLSVATVFLICLLAYLQIRKLDPIAEKNGTDTDPTADARHVALLSGHKDVQWLDGTAPNRVKLSAGQRLAITTGLLEIRYLTGARVVLEG
ncbi:MAG: hypothetical protein MI757_12055, partial [Pirellulales bacterium]|nr:hypothetical protein [Pirellulales bacterium]